MSRSVIAAAVAVATAGTLLPTAAWAGFPAAPARTDVPEVEVAELDLAGVAPEALGALPAEAPAPAEDTGGVSAQSAPQDAAGTAGAPAPDVLTAELDTAPFSVLGVTWDPSPELEGVVVRYRVRQADVWTDWEAVGASDVAPDANRQEAADATTRGATDPIVAIDADGVQLWAEAEQGTVTGLKAVLIDPGESAADANAVAAAAVPVPGQPAIVSRAGWGADESLKTCVPDFSTSMDAAAVHHTASANGYSQDSVPGLIRGFYEYHTRAEAAGGRGWCDLGYNFLVDRFGTIYEGRAGGITSTVVGVHTGGFNSRTIGIAAIGEYGAALVPDVLTNALASLIAWKFSIHGITAGTTVQMVSGGGASKWPEGTVVNFPTIYGHRDAQLTSCPGQNLYDLLPYLNARVADLANAAVSVSPRGTWESTSTTSSSISVGGWAFDPETAAPITVEVRVNGAHVASVAADRPRADIGSQFPAVGPNHGFAATIPAASGTVTVCVAAVNVGEGTTVSLGCRNVTVRNSAPIGAVDSIVANGTTLTVSGWTLDPDTTASNEVHIYVDGVGVSLLANQSRPDVAAVYNKGDKHGFSYATPAGPGDHSVCVYGIDTGGGANTVLACRTVSSGAVARTAPIGAIEQVTATNTSLTVTGWTLDPDTTASNQVHLYVDGVGTALVADVSRPDLASRYGKGDKHGFTFTTNARPGPHSVCAHGINTGPGDNTLLGCRTIVVPDAAPIGVIDAVTTTNTQLALSGWSLDPDTSASNEVHIYIDGVGVSLLANQSRPDVAAVYNKGDKHGWSYVVPAAPGRHDLCVYGINTAAGANTLLGCRTVVVPDAAPIGVIDAVTTSAGRLTITGWTLDPDTSASNQVHIYVEGVGYSLWADRSRPDVAAVYNRGDKHGYSHSVAVPAGSRSVCAFGINTAAGANTLLGCRTVVVP
ncbi:N-acetylmuramoyl-L-alanine amidase [Actinotalea solisilvae]|uniref:N-acetylmuramoyl-L-alanine amidase n=1 Tax=Actinotalea solisilvae TaxID=2072922 RepID=UPI0018F20AC3|nr:N-acetylmuramoyl-L-alanine amidase [Actinotalea solisilvae]